MNILSLIAITGYHVALLAACELCQVLLGYFLQAYTHDVGQTCGLPKNIADFGKHQLALIIGYVPDLSMADLAILITLGGGDVQLTFAHVLASLACKFAYFATKVGEHIKEIITLRKAGCHCLLLIFV